MHKQIATLYRALSGQVENTCDEITAVMNMLSREAVLNSDQIRFDKDKKFFSHFVRQRKEGVPLEYILGMAFFMGLILNCSPATLIPRKETELLVKTALQKIADLQKTNDKELKIIDLGTGCGNIAVSLAVYINEVTIMATDISEQATRVALTNVGRYGLEKRVSVYCGDLLEPFEALNVVQKIDMIVCNPPYLPSVTVKKLPAAIKDHEPIIALDAGPYGVNIFMRFINDALNYLKAGGYLIFEIGSGQDKLVTRLLDKNGGYENIEYFYDGPEIRVISARKKSPGCLSGAVTG